MWSILAKKKTIKEAWEAVRNMRIRSDHVKTANAQCLMMEFENITFKDGEMVDEFDMCIESLAESLRALRETLTDARLVKKMLHVLPKQFSQITASIETLLDVNTMKVEDLVSRLKLSEDRIVVKEIIKQGASY
jgi:methylthioribose-1-phosphate isomerase